MVSIGCQESKSFVLSGLYDKMQLSSKSIQGSDDGPCAGVSSPIYDFRLELLTSGIHDPIQYYLLPTKIMHWRTDQFPHCVK